MNWNWKRKQKWLISQTVIVFVLFFSVLPAAAVEPTGQDVRPAVMERAESESEKKTEANIETDFIDDMAADSENGSTDDTSTDIEADSEDDASADSEGNAAADSETDSEDIVSSVHECSWSSDWNYDESCHWHECDAEDCPVTDHNEKDGYAEHSYGEDNICIDCGYFRSDNCLTRTAAGVVPTCQEVYEAMVGLKDQYPEGMTWTNFEPYGSRGELGASYVWKGGKVYGANSGVGCAAFAFILSDTAFGDLPARVIENGSFTFADVKAGDILRINGGSHSVIVLQKSAGGVIIAEANYNKTVHWGRAMSEAEVLTASYMITRYPNGYVPSDDPDADEVIKNGTEGSLSWTLTKAGTLTVSGSGTMPDYSADHLPPWNEPGISTVIIGNGVTGIGDYAFYQNSALNIYIPDGITKIGQNAFSKSGLISVTIPGTVEVIKNSAFRDCKNLTSATVSEGIKTIGDEAFRGCTSLAYIDFPTSITSVGAGAFMSCEKMTRIRFMPGSENVELGENLFSQCWHLTDVTLPQTADRISDGMFQSCLSLPALYIPASVTNIGLNPFTSCSALKYIYFGGTETEWKKMMTPYLEASLKSTGTTVTFNAAFNDPFAPDPDDPGDFWPDEDGKDPAGPDDENKDDPDHSDGDHKHNWSEIWNSDENGHWHECDTGCTITDNRDKDGYGTHSYGSWVIDADATASQNGSKHRDCTVCSYRQTDRIPASGSSDDSNSNNGGSNDDNSSSNGNGGGSGSSNGGSSNGNGGGSGSSNGGSSNGNSSGSGSSNGGSSNGNSGGSGSNNSTARTPGTTGGLDHADPKDTEKAFDESSENDESKPFSDGQNEPADTESLPSQNLEETGMAAENDESEIPYTSDKEAETENVSSSDKGRSRAIVTILAVFVGGAAGFGFVFMKKRGRLKK